MTASFEKRGPSSTHPKFKKNNALHSTICGKCGAHCEVPFKPNGERPVLCNRCFKRDGAAPRFNASEKRFGDDRSTSFQSENPSPVSKSIDPALQKQLNQINAKLDQILDLISEYE